MKITTGIAAFSVKLNLAILALAFVMAAEQKAIGQIKYTGVIIDKHMKDTFSFANNWDYSWEVFKDESTGVFTKNSSQPLLPADTAHLYYTANCFTNVQGGYHIRYCYAYRQKDKLVVKFTDGLPAYGSMFFLYIKGDSCYFQPRTIYPLYMEGQKITYQVKKTKLILNKSNCKVGDLLMGSVDIEFVESISLPKRGTKNNVYYLKGDFRTTLKYSKPQ